jgi:hypothetical protein
MIVLGRAFCVPMGFVPLDRVVLTTSNVLWAKFAITTTLTPIFRLRLCVCQAVEKTRVAKTTKIAFKVCVSPLSVVRVPKIPKK